VLLQGPNKEMMVECLLYRCKHLFMFRVVSRSLVGYNSKFNEVCSNSFD